MILGRPTNLWLAAIQGVWAALAVLANIEGSPLAGLSIYLTPVVWGVVSLALAGLMGLVAYQPPTLAPGDKFTVATAPGQPNYVTTVAPPPAHDAPPVPQPTDGPAG